MVTPLRAFVALILLAVLAPLLTALIRPHPPCPKGARCE